MTMEFEVDHSGEDITRELSRASVPPPRSERRAILRVPAIPAGLGLVELETASAELDRCRVIAAAAVAALAAAEARRGGARNADLAEGADALRRGETPAPRAVAALELDIRGLVGNRDAARVLVAQCEMQVGAVLSERRVEYSSRLDAAIAADRADALSALDAYEDSRGTVIADLNLKGWLSGDRKWQVSMPDLRGIGQPAPATEAVLAALRRELA